MTPDDPNFFWNLAGIAVVIWVCVIVNEWRGRNR